MTSGLVPYLPGISGLLALAGTLALTLSFIGIGFLTDREPVAGGPDTLLISGWGCVLLVATLFGAITAIPLMWALGPMLLIGFVAAVFPVRNRREDLSASLRILLIGAPLLLIVAAASASQWDEFAHWLINQRYLVEVGTFPRTGLPENSTIHAAYPYGLAIVGFLVSYLTGAFAENAGALFNTVLILAFAVTMIRAFRGGAGLPDYPISWWHAGAGFLAVTLFNPSFVPKLAFTTYADWPTAVVFGITTWVAWRMVEVLSVEPSRAVPAARQLGLAMVVLVGLKQPNLILALLLLAGLAAAALLGPARPSRRVLQHCALWVLGPPLLTYLAWRYHVAHHIPGREFGFHPLSEWQWFAVGSILARMALIASKKGGYFGLMLAASGMAVHALVRALAGRPVSPVARLAVLVGLPFAGYNAFLYVAYLGSFGGEGLYAASYWRYNTQLGGAALIFAAVGLGVLHSRWRTALPRMRAAGAAVVVLLALAMPLAFAQKIRFDMNPVTRYVRDVGIDIGSLVVPGRRLWVVDPDDNGKRTIVLRYEVHRAARVERLAGIAFADATALRSALPPLQDAYVWIHVPSLAMAEAFGVPLAPRSSHLLEWENGWRVMRSWPYPGYANPQTEDD